MAARRRKSQNWTTDELAGLRLAAATPAKPESARTRGQKNKKQNTGKWLEKDLADCHEVYEQQGVARLRKADPPTQVIRPPGKGPIVIQLRNPFLDFVGVWQARQGRAIFAEAKSTMEDRLAFDSDSGIKEHQRESLQAWRAAGAAVCVLWGFQGAVRYLSLGLIESRMANGAKSILWAHADAIPAGLGFLRFDWLKNLADDFSE